MKGTPRIRALLPAKFLGAGPRPKALPTRSDAAPRVFADYTRTLGVLERAATTSRPADKEGR